MDKEVIKKNKKGHWVYEFSTFFNGNCVARGAFPVFNRYQNETYQNLFENWGVIGRERDFEKGYIRL